ncbi:MAG: NAD(P)H-hydrate epimerase [Novosphingobium sp.]
MTPVVSLAGESASDPILTVAQMRAAEEVLIAAGTSVEALMRIAGRGAGEWVWRVSSGQPVTVLCGPGNNGGDGYVLAELIRERGGDVAVIAPREPTTVAAQDARAAYRGPIVAPDAARGGAVFVDCLFGSGLTRPLTDDAVARLQRLAAGHVCRVAADLPSGVDSDRGTALNPGLPRYDLTIALGAWKFAHWTLPAAAAMGALRLVGIGIGEVAGAATLLRPPRLSAPAVDAHKYRRGLLAVVAGAMPGAALLACAAAQRSGAGYVKLLGDAPAPADLVVDRRPCAEALADPRIGAALVGPGLGRDLTAADALATILEAGMPAVLDADALVLLRPAMLAARAAPLVLTPHEGEMAALERAFGLVGDRPRRDRAVAMARSTGAVIVLKGPHSIIAAPGGELVCAPAAPSWLSVAGSGDVLAGILAARLATGADPLAAACDALWLHGEAARRAGPAFTPGQLAERVQEAVAAALA